MLKGKKGDGPERVREMEHSSNGIPSTANEKEEDNSEGGKTVSKDEREM